MKNDLEKYDFIFNREGIARNDRYLNALNPARIAIDDRKLEDFIVFARRYSKNILYVPTQGEINPEQSWESFFKDDSIFLMASIASKEPQDIKQTYERLAGDFRDKSSAENLIKIAEYVFSRYKKIDEWYHASSADTELNKDIFLHIKSRLSGEITKLNEIFNYLSRIGSVEEKYLRDEHLINKNDVWEFSLRSTILSQEDPFTGKTEKEKIENAYYTLNQTFDAVFHVTSNIIKKCQDNIVSSVFNQQNNPPHIALFVAFIKLYGYVQNDLNRIPEKLLEYYYKEVLGIKAQKAIPDKAFIVFDLAKEFDFAAIKKGTALTAGKDKTNVNLTYKTDKDILVNKAQVTAIKSIFVPKNRSGILNFFAATIKTGGQNTIASATGWSAFGTAEASIAVVGFAVASSQIYLARGQRNISLLFEVTSGIEIGELDATLLSLRLTGEKGWIASANPKDYVTVEYFKKVEDNKLELNFAISIEQESAVVPFNPGIHAGSYTTTYPVLEILLQFPPLPIVTNEHNINEYLEKIKKLNYLLSIAILNTEIKVQVGTIGQKANFDGIRELILQNNESVLDPKKPFSPFTSVPHVGSSFYIGCNDLFYKPNLTLTLNIEWMLPENFRSYYDKYLPPYDSNKYMAELSMLKNRNWEKFGDVSIIDTDADDPKFRVIPVNQTQADQTDDPKNETSKFATTKPDGTLRLKLNYPDFGHEIYPQVITATVMENAASKAGAVDFYKVIKKQLHNSAISIKYPGDVGNREGSLKRIVYNILESKKEAEEAKARMIFDLTKKLREINGSEISTDQIKSSISSEATNTKIVNDDNFFERIIRHLKDLKLIDQNVHFDKNKDDVEYVIEGIDNRLDKYVNFILPDDHQMVALIIEETNSVISKVASKIVEKLFALRAIKVPDEKSVANIFEKEINDANEVINELIAHKIATLLSAREIPPKPYTPLVNTLAISYSSTKKLVHGEDQYFQILPFGVREIELFDNEINAETDEINLDKTASAFPDYLNLINKGRVIEGGASGLLFLGIKDILPNQSISILIQLAEGVGKSDKAPPGLDWWYLKNNEWVEFKNEYLVSDGTAGLQTTGIIEISIPNDANNDNTIFEENGLFWVGISVPKDVDAFPRLVDIIAQAATVTFDDDGNDRAHLSSPLPAKKIINFTEKLPAVKSVHQPVVSIDGKMSESQEEFYIRVSERLRHKGRAVNAWDYERLVLEYFPLVYKVKCINNYYSGALAVGHVTIVPIANLPFRAPGSFEIVIPRMSHLELLKIEQLIQSKSSPFVKVHAINPQLDYIKISCKVRFNEGQDKGYYLKQLNEDIISFLTPWITDNNDNLTFFSKIYASNVITFIDKRPYVDYVTDLFMIQYTLNSRGIKTYCKSDNQTDLLVETQFTTSHSILISAPEHDIQLL